MRDEDKTKAELLAELSQLRKQAHWVAQCPVDLEQYVRTVTRDIKQPLGLMVGYAEFLLELYRDKALDVELQRDIELIAQRGRLASDLVSELLSLLYVPRVEERFCYLLDMRAIFGRAYRRVANVVEGWEMDIIVPERWPPACGRELLVEQLWVKILGYTLRLHPRATLRRLEVGGTLLPDTQPGMVRFWIQCETATRTPFPSPIWLSSTDAAALAEHLPIAYCIAQKLGGEIGLEFTQDMPAHSVIFFTLPEN